MNVPSTTVAGTRLWLEFRKSGKAMLGLWTLIGLYLIAALAPFLANDHPLVATPGGRLSFPVLSALEPIEWRFLFYSLAVALIVWRRAWFVANYRRLGFFLCALVVGTEIFVAVVPDNNSVDSTSSGFHLMPPIPYSPEEIGPVIFSPPTWTHLLGTDLAGRDVASRLIHGARSSLSIAVVAQAVSLLIGVAIGLITGFYKSWVDQLFLGLMNVLDCFPWLLLVLVVIGLFGSQNNMVVIMLVLGTTGWTPLARLVRGEILRLSAQPFIMAAQALGASGRRIMIRHLIPNTLGLIMVNSTFGVASIILAESSLDFLGFGLQAPTASWGDTLSSGQGYLDVAWWLTLFPSLIMFLAIMAYNFVGEGLRDAAEPGLREVG